MSKESNTRRWVLGVFLVAITLAGIGFAWKLYEFTDDLLDQHGLGFAGVHLLTYCLVAVGFASLLAACFLRGHFRDIEQAKFDLLEKERRYDLELRHDA
jgi:hypothetical protein